MILKCVLHKCEIEFDSSYKESSLCSGGTLCDSAHKFDFSWFFLYHLLKYFYCPSLHLRFISFPIRPSACIPSFEAVETEQLIASSCVQQTYWTELAVVITVMKCRFPKRRGMFDRKSTTSFSRMPPLYGVSMYTSFALSKRTYLF